MFFTTLGINFVVESFGQQKAHSNINLAEDERACCEKIVNELWRTQPALNILKKVL